MKIGQKVYSVERINSSPRWRIKEFFVAKVTPKQFRLSHKEGKLKVVQQAYLKDIIKE